jgi:hypothetical protein
MARIGWVIASSLLSLTACGGPDSDKGSEPDKGTEPASSAPEAVSRGADGIEPVSAYTFSEDPSGLLLEAGSGATRRSFRCENVCEQMCSSCLYEACMASGASAEQCVRSRDACTSSCSFCPQGGTLTACYSPCLKNEPRCFSGLDLIMPDEVVRPEVTPDEAQSTRDQVTREEGTPADDVRPASDSTPSEQASGDQASSSSSSTRPGNGERTR